METAALCKPIQRFADLLRIPDTWVLTGLGKLLAALGSFPHFPQPLRLLHTHLYWRFLECQSIEVTLTQNGHLTHHEIPSVASLRPGGHFPRIGWPVSPEYAVASEWSPCTTWSGPEGSYAGRGGERHDLPVGVPRTSAGVRELGCRFQVRGPARERHAHGPGGGCAVRPARGGSLYNRPRAGRGDAVSDQRGTNMHWEAERLGVLTVPD